MGQDVLPYRPGRLLFVTSDAATISDLSTMFPQEGHALGDSSVDPVSKEGEKAIALVNGLILIPLFTLLGVPGNIVSVVVFYRQGLRERINLCLFALAIVDLIVVLVLFFPYAEGQLRALLLLNFWFFTTSTPGLIGFVWASQFLSAVIASERCFCVVSPFHAKRLLKTSTMAAIIVVCCVVLVGGMAAIAGPKTTVVSFLDPFTNISTQKFYVTRYYLENKVILDSIDTFLYATGLPGVFLVVIIVATSITVRKLRSAVLDRRFLTMSTNRLSAKEVGLTKILIGTSVLFIICLTPNFVGQVMTFIVPDLSFSGRYRNTNFMMWAFISLLRVVKSSVNVIIYYVMGTKFRQTFYDILRCFRFKK